MRDPVQTAQGISRRTFLERTGAAALAVAGGTLWRAASAAGAPAKTDTPLRHIVISCQENRSFDLFSF
jgi:phospholipase C